MVDGSKKDLHDEVGVPKVHMNKKPKFSMRHTKISTRQAVLQEAIRVSMFL